MLSIGVNKKLDRRAGRTRKMATEGHKCGRREDLQQKRKAEMDQELNKIRAEMDRLALKMHQEVKVHWTYEWPLKRKV
jgi:hypothetical protein